jgi:hypothetical protein
MAAKAAAGFLSIMFLSSHAVLASGVLYYGSRAGMVVSVVSVSGLDSSRAVIRTKHTRANALAYCRDYVLKVTAQCIQQELAKPLNDEVTANCQTGVFTDFMGSRYQFKGESKAANAATKYLIADLPSQAVEDGSEASGYPTNIAIFKALCPNEAPLNDE